MKTDLELLKLAAKAAGYNNVDFNEYADSTYWFPKGYEPDGDVTNWWNPLIDDGDALQLAAKLGIEYGYGWSVELPSIITTVIVDDSIQIDAEGSDIPAAIRRAIVLAAAQDGERMK